MTDAISGAADLAAAQAAVRILAASNAAYAAAALQLYAGVQASTEQLRAELERALGVGRHVDFTA